MADVVFDTATRELTRMGLLKRMFGGQDDVQVSAIDVEAKRSELEELDASLKALIRRMGEDGFPVDNPGWQGRISDLSAARTAAQQLSSRPTFDRQDVFDVTTTVRPLYRGEPAPQFAGLETENDRLLAALDALQA